MPVLVHLADEREAASIKKNGIKIGKFRNGIYCMPVLQNFYVSHQWLRELKRRGVKTFAGIYFKLDSETPVYAGKYNETHKQITLGEAIKEIMSLADPLGYQLIIDRKIEAKEIQKIKALPQKIGWRYMPSSHSRKPACGCAMCIPLGSIKSKKLRNKLEPPVKEESYVELLEKLKFEDDEDEIENLLWKIKCRKRRSDPNELLFLLNKRSDVINRALALAFGAFSKKNSRTILWDLLKSKDDDTREFAANSLLKLYGKEMENILSKKNDPAIKIALKEWKK